MSRKKKKPSYRKRTEESLAKQADRHVLYEKAVQCVEAEIDMVDQNFKTLRGRRAISLREDFCGTANTSCEWVRRRSTNFAVGIDIQNIAEFSKLIDGKDLKKSNFIKDYFTDKEIVYSESRPDAIETICGIYSAKESIRKAGNENDFKKIEITHANGRPVFKNYYISISHSAGLCVAVCIQT